MKMREQNLDEDKKKRLERFLTDWMNEGNIPSVSVALIEGEELVYSGGFGARDLKKNLPARSTTLYGIGSCSKSFTALGVLQLVEKGELYLESSVEDHLPVEWGSDVTVHELLTHSCGMPSLAVAEVLIDRLIGMDERGAPLGGWDDFYVHLNGAEEEMVEKDERFFYFNSGYDLLGKLIEETSGMSYSRYVKKNILEPLEMKRSTFEYEEDDEDFMTPYFIRDGEPEECSYPNSELGYASGGLLSCVDELANYVKMNMNRGSYGGQHIIDENLLEKAHTGYVESEIGMYGYGWAVNEFMGKELVGHGGSVAVASAYLGFDEDHGVALACNTSPSYSMEEIGKGVLAVMKGKDPEKLPFFARKEKMKTLSGEYESYRGLKKAEIDIEGGLLRLKFKERLEEQKVMLIPKTKKMEENEFYYVAGDGEKHDVMFDVMDKDEIDLYIGRWRLHKA